MRKERRKADREGRFIICIVVIYFLVIGTMNYIFEVTKPTDTYGYYESGGSSGR